MNRTKFISACFASTVSMVFSACMSHSGASAGGMVSHAAQASASFQENTVRVKFVPGPAGHKYWTKFAPLPNGGGSSYMEAHLHLGDQCPVQSEAGTTLFDIRLVAGDSDKLKIDVCDSEGTTRIQVPRGEPGVKIKLGEEGYTLVFPDEMRLATDAKRLGPTDSRATVFVLADARKN